MKQLEYSQLKGINQFYVFSHHPTAQQTPLISKIFNATTVGSVLKQGLKFYTGWQFDHIKITIIKKHPLAKKYKTRQKIQVWSETQYHHLISYVPTEKFRNKMHLLQNKKKKKNRQKSYLK